MKKIFLFLFFVSIFAISAKAQVTIGSDKVPERGAILELLSDSLGFLPTRVHLVSLDEPDPLPVHVEGIVVYNLTMRTDSLFKGLYYNNGAKWVRLSINSTFAENWFYMPSIVFDTRVLGPQAPLDLYKEFKDQLNASLAPEVRSDGAPPMALSAIPEADELYYYVTAYDPDVFEIISISNLGVMTYNIKATATDATFINIVFVEK